MTDARTAAHIRIPRAIGFLVRTPVWVAVTGALLTGCSDPAPHGWPASNESRAPLVVARRGDIANYPENTTEGIIAAAEAGADGIELDVRLTADSVLVVIHDDDIARTTTGTGLVSEITYDTLAAASVDGGLGYRAGVHRGLQVPRLTDVLDALAEYRGLLLFDVKAPGRVPRKAIVEMIGRYGLADRAWIANYEPSADADALVVKTMNASITTYLPGRLADRLADHPHIDYYLVNASELAQLAQAEDATAVIAVVPESHTADESEYLSEVERLAVSLYLTNDLADTLSWFALQ